MKGFGVRTGDQGVHGFFLFVFFSQQQISKKYEMLVCLAVTITA